MIPLRPERRTGEELSKGARSLEIVTDLSCPVNRVDHLISAAISFRADDTAEKISRLIWEAMSHHRSDRLFSDFHRSASHDSVFFGDMIAEGMVLVPQIMALERGEPIDPQFFVPFALDVFERDGIPADYEFNLNGRIRKLSEIVGAALNHDEAALKLLKWYVKAVLPKRSRSGAVYA